MKKNLLALTVAGALLASSAVANAAISNNFYMGLRAGAAFSNWDNSDRSYYQEGDNNAFGVGVFAGYSFNPYFSLEGGYNYINGFDAELKNAYKGLYDEREDINIHGPEIAARLSFPVSEAGSDIFLRGGAMYAFASGSSDRFAPLVGVGANLMLSDNFAIRLGYDHYFSVYDDDGPQASNYDIDFDMGLAYVGFQYHFGVTKAPAPVPTPVSKTVTTSYTLDANTNFAFDKDVLSVAGQDAVGQIVVDAKNSNIEFAKYTVTGYTDRIGNAAYNQKLSERRAQAVADELMAKGVPAGDIVATGMGSSNSVVGDKCDGKTGRDLIVCLAPDRRVEINLTGTVTEVQQVAPETATTK